MFAFVALVFLPLVAPLVSMVNAERANAPQLSKRYEYGVKEYPSEYGKSYDSYRPQYYKNDGASGYGDSYYKPYGGHHHSHSRKTRVKQVHQCNTGPVQCCDTIQHSGDPKSANLLSQIGLANTQNYLGFSCSPFVLKASVDQSCTTQPVCCTNTTFEGFIAIGCTPINKLDPFII